MLDIKPITFREACAFIAQNHRHHKPPQGMKFAIAAVEDDQIVGVVVVGRPVARRLDDGWTAEVTRLCTDGTKNVSSKLLGAAWRAARGMGYKRMITYTLPEEGGASLRASNWRLVGVAGGGNWNKPARPREDSLLPQQKHLWEID